MLSKSLIIDNKWTLFLDRDGVINEHKKNGYVSCWEEFKFCSESVEAIRLLANYFRTIIIVTNQRGVGKGLIAISDLDNIHDKMLQVIREAGGRIDHIEYCIDTDDRSINRKPQLGMAISAQRIFPHIDLRKSIMVGDQISDMEFGRNAGMYNVLISDTDLKPFPDLLVDYRYKKLIDFALYITNTMSGKESDK